LYTLFRSDSSSHELFLSNYLSPMIFIVDFVGSSVYLMAHQSAKVIRANNGVDVFKCPTFPVFACIVNVLCSCIIVLMTEDFCHLHAEYIAFGCHKCFAPSTDMAVLKSQEHCPISCEPSCCGPTLFIGPLL
jgi:hypothetical protein